MLTSKKPFTALVSFNDNAAIGAIHALQDAGLRVPADVSVIGFDDIRAAAFISPSLTTIRQPLREMGWMASEYLLGRLQGTEKYREQIVIYPELTVRESTGAVALADRAPTSSSKARKSAKNRDAAPRNRIAALAKD
jgi:DNA-binding LacI/PurR family transcriptional regulator